MTHRSVVEVLGRGQKGKVKMERMDAELSSTCGHPPRLEPNPCEFSVFSF
jgi:hypothetical protein